MQKEWILAMLYRALLDFEKSEGDGEGAYIATLKAVTTLLIFLRSEPPPFVSRWRMKNMFVVRGNIVDVNK